jgi:hypothetical protein
MLGCTPVTAPVTAQVQPYSLQIVDETGNSLPTYQRAGKMFVLGTIGQRYFVRVHNSTARRIEVVASVDGRDVIDGRPAAWGKRGYIVDPYGVVSIDGYRLSQEAVAAFRFSSVPQSYAAQMGNARDVGVIGVAVFTERPLVVPMPMPMRGHSEPMDSSGMTSEKSESAPAPAPQSGSAARSPAPAERPGLGTEFGEEHSSQVYTVHFERASTSPAAVLSVRYNDRAGLLAVGIDVDGHGWYSRRDTWLRETAEPFRSNASFSQPPPGWRR